ncbi:MAG: hypothetical protein HY811_11895 [Planctomycetes bacterium]|nr:hypothetical protein [Planctomycetota bacterium]
MRKTLLILLWVLIVSCSNRENDAIFQKALQNIKRIDSTDVERNSYKSVVNIELVFKGKKLNKIDVDKLEALLKKEPFRLDIHIQLIGYYVRNNKEDQKEYEEHLIWAITNYPDLEFVVSSFLQVDSIISPNLYKKIEKLWLRQIEVNNDNHLVLLNASNFFFHANPNLAEKLLKNAKVLAPENYDISRYLTTFYEVHDKPKEAENEKKGFAANRLKKLESQLGESLGADYFYCLLDITKQAYISGSFEKAVDYANKLLKESSKFENDWNYGNAIHHGYIILGLVSFKSGDIVKARDCLIRSGLVSGSPQLNSFGPDMTLAKLLLKSGKNTTPEKDDVKAVIQYLQNCKNFWRGEVDLLDAWIKTIESGGTPDFDKNCHYDTIIP